LPSPGAPFEQDVAAREEADDRAAHDGVVPDVDAADLRFEPREAIHRATETFLDERSHGAALPGANVSK
jgi:hypothetical protein